MKLLANSLLSPAAITLTRILHQPDIDYLVQQVLAPVSPRRFGPAKIKARRLSSSLLLLIALSVAMQIDRQLDGEAYQVEQCAGHVSSALQSEC